MSSQKLSYLFKTALIMLIVCCSVSNSYSVTYTIIDLGDLGGSSNSKPIVINEKAHIAGKYRPFGSTYDHAFFSDGRTRLDLGVLGVGPNSYAGGINDHDHVTGISNLTWINNYRAFIHDGESMQDIGTLGGDKSFGLDINNSGWVAGASDTGNGYNKAFIYDGENMINLGTLAGEPYSESSANGINESGQVIGTTDTYRNDDPHAFIYDENGMRDLGTLGSNISYGRAINDLGHATGDSGLVTNSIGHHAFFYDGNTMHDIETLGGYNSYGYDINNNDYIVGYTSNVGGFLYDGTSMKALCDLTDCAAGGWSSLGSAYGINDNGDIVGVGSRIGFNRPHIFIMCAMQGTADGDVAPLDSPDGVVNVGDYLIMQRLALGELTPNCTDLSHGDLYPPGSPDGVINIQDLILHKQLLQ